MPNGKPLSGASGAAEFASSAIAFRRIDYWLKPRRNASARLSPRAPRTTPEAACGIAVERISGSGNCGRGGARGARSALIF
jgi:hypothetical protein